MKGASKITIGIDEVGRGPLAGPVVVCALALSAKLKNKSEKLKIKDSKQLTVAQREWWFAWIKENGVLYATARATSKTIDRITITRAANRAAHHAYKKLNSQIYRSPPSIIMDGGLYLPKHIPHRTIIKADEKYPAVALASIIAKVTRDRFMTQQHKKYPCYQFAQHKGYGTKKHITAIKHYGACPLHRISFIKNII